MDNKATWKMIRNFVIGQKCQNTSPDVDVIVLDDKFFNINVSNPDSGIYDDPYFVQWENPLVFVALISLKSSNAYIR